MGSNTVRELAGKGYIAVGRHDAKRKTWAVSYLYRALVNQILSGAIEISRYNEIRNVVEVRYTGRPTRRLKTVWQRSRHDAGAYGADLLGDFLGARIFPFPKSLYAVSDALSAVVSKRPDALIVDFFAGSGTTLHATCLLNRVDGGRRRCILVTNNEVGPEMRQRLLRQRHYRGAQEYEQHGIFEAVTRPRCEAVITGMRPDGQIVAGTYLDGRPYADGFEENVEFFRLDYLDGEQVELGRCFESIHPLLWLTAGGRGKRPDVDPGASLLLAPESGYAVLLREDDFRDFADALAEHEGIGHVFLVTDSEEAYAEMRE